VAPHGASSSPPPAGRITGRILRIAAVGVLVSVVVFGVGRWAERRALGATDQTARAHVASTVERDIADLAARLDRAARDLAQAGPIPLDETDVAGRGASFDHASAVLAAFGPDIDAVAVYDARGRALSWAGRPSPLPAERLTGATALFVAPGGFGLRLVHVQPIPAEPGRRGGAVVAEAPLTHEGAGHAPGSVRVSHRTFPLRLRAPFEDGGERRSPNIFSITGPDGRPLVSAEVAPETLAALRATYRAWTRSLTLLGLAVTLVVIALVLREGQEIASTPGRSLTWLAGVMTALVLARVALASAVPSHWHFAEPGLASTVGRAWLASPLDILATALLALALVALVFDLTERYRLTRPTRSSLSPWLGLVLAGLTTGVILVWHAQFLAAIVRLHGNHDSALALFPITLARAPLVAGVLGANAAVLWLAVALIRLAVASWRVRAEDYLKRGIGALIFLAAATAMVSAASGTDAVLAHVPPLALVVVAAAAARWVLPRFRRASQAARLTIGYLTVVLPSLAFYPALVSAGHATVEETITGNYAEQALTHRERLRSLLGRSQEQLDATADLASEFAPGPESPEGYPDATPAFHLWSQTELGRQRLTSSLELYTPEGDLVSRFALNLPAEFLATERPVDIDCAWDVFGEALASTDDQVLLHAGRAICLPDGTRVGSVLVHVVLDYATLPFVADLDPAGVLVRVTGGPAPTRGPQSIAFAVYGWGRTPVYPTAGTAWPIRAALLERIYRMDRRPFWEELQRGDRRYRVYLNNDRAGIYAIGYVLPRPIDHAVALAEIATLAGVAFVALLALMGVVGRLAGRRPATGRELLREIRSSFYRKLFLLFVLASVVPVLALAVVTRNYLAGQLREGLESGALRTASAARRVIETVVSQQRRNQRDPLVAVTDEIMVSVSRIIDQDVNVFVRDTLVATSQRDLFASGVLSTRIPAEVARTISLERQSSHVGDERLGDFEYTLAAVPVRDGESGAVLTVPLTLRQQEIENEVAALDRRVVLAGVLFILLGSAIGYVTAERLGDPIQRLTRAAGRIARGDLDARIATTHTDELGRLVEAFNRMAEDLQRQRAELERSNRLAAWADMARQVAHDIKNPLTPIQLSAEFLRRVHADSGSPLGPVVDKTTATILSQVTLLRQIASEFSSFASSPVARFAPTDLGDLLEEVLGPYETGLPADLTLDVQHDPRVPELWLDRGLLARALVNVIENALHAMRGGGTLRVMTAPHAGGVQIAVSDTGVGMDADALERLFEPYFSTKATGTGLGLTIAKRNVELNGGTIAVDSVRGTGTTVTISLPARDRDAASSPSPPR
jgi:signal transduction histidine kinase